MARLRAYGLEYHDIVGGDHAESGFPGAGPARYKITWPTFLEHLDRIGEVVPVPPSLVAPVAGDDGASSWSLTFDDGGTSAVEVGEELVRREWRAYFFVTTSLIGTAGFLDADGIRALDAMGHAIGSHSVTHPSRMAALPLEDLLYEWQASVDALSELVGREIRTGSVPGGWYGTHVATAAVRAGIETLFTSEPVRTARRVDGCLLVGRYAIREMTSARDAAAAAAGDPSVWLRQYAGWSLRKPAKAIGGRHYDRVRGTLLAARSRRVPR
ncbi:MAG TPA: polysaccharide deacetylase family protein [Gaiellaceae bacterium]|nr:polysaccharide deacetylase family protein [Gaiellaceae bacterium]